MKQTFEASRYVSIYKSCGVRGSATTKTKHVILDFNMLSEIITFDEKGKFGKEKHQNLGVEVKWLLSGKWKHINEILEN